MQSNFFALFSRMKNINRWALMRNNQCESLSQHSLEVSAIAHALAVLGNERLNKNYDASLAALIGIFHDMPEIVTGDMPTPVKYYNDEIRASFGKIEKAAQQSILDTLPEDLKKYYSPLLIPDESTDIYRLVKAADKISALIKCEDEKNTGNKEFEAAEKSTLKAINAMNCDEANMFIEEFLPGFSLTLDVVLEPENEKSV